MKLLSIIKNIIIIILTVMLLFVITMMSFEFKGYSVVTDSMSPKINRGDVVFVKQISFDKLKVGDIVTVKFENSDSTFTHRIVEIDKNDNEFYTQGDNATEKDGKSKAENIIGKVMFSIPLAGYLSIGLGNKNVLAVGIGAIVLIFIVLRIIIYKLNKKQGVTENEQN